MELLLLRGGSAKAYDLQEDMQARHGRVAPTTIYRALDFLIEMHLVHRVDSLNTFVICNASGDEHHILLIVCVSCQEVTELQDETAYRAMSRHLAATGLEFQETSIEIKGVCKSCQTLRALHKQRP